jgi:hypothetical protein
MITSTTSALLEESTGEGNCSSYIAGEMGCLRDCVSDARATLDTCNLCLVVYMHELLDCLSERVYLHQGATQRHTETHRDTHHTHHTTPHHTTPHHTTPHHTTPHHTTPHNTTQHLSTAQHSTAQHITAQQSTAQHTSAQHSTTLHRSPHHLLSTPSPNHPRGRFIRKSISPRPVTR